MPLIQPPRRVLLSFLGTNKYEECVYYFEDDRDQSYGVDRFVQNSIFKHLCRDWSSEDKYFVFLTEQAEPANWNGDKYDDKKGLNETLAKNGFAVTPTAVREMPEGYSEEQIWQVFQRVFDCLEPSDQVWLDITHGFRSLPLLATVLIDYARFLKNVKIEKIYYGVFESLGTGPQIKEKYPNPADRWVPVLDLTAFSQLQDWTSAANDFINFGSADKLKSLADTQAKIEIISKGNKSNQARDIKYLSNHLVSAVQHLGTNRGSAISEGTVFGNVKDTIQRLADTNFIAPYKYLFTKISDKVADFQLNQVLNFVPAVQFCLDHGLVQQGITQLHEGIISYLLAQLGHEWKINGKNGKESRKHRELLSSVLNYLNAKEAQQNQWRPELINDPLFELWKSNDLVNEFVNTYTALTNFRNDINHGGYSDSKNPDTFIKALKKHFDATKNILQITTT